MGSADRSAIRLPGIAQTLLIWRVLEQRCGEPRAGDTSRFQDFHLRGDLEYTPLTSSACVGPRQLWERRHCSHSRKSDTCFQERASMHRNPPIGQYLLRLLLVQAISRLFLAYLLTHSAAQRNTVEPFWCGRPVAPVPRKSAVCFFYLQGGRIANGQYTSSSAGTATDPGGAGRVVTAVGNRGEPGDPDVSDHRG